MKVICSQQNLHHGLSAVGHAVSSRSTLPILANILLATDHGCLKLSATNLEMGITCRVDAQIEEEGTTTIPAKLITDFVNSLPQAPVELILPVDSNTLHLKSLRSSANIKGMDPSEFPQIPSNEGGDPPVLLDAALLKEMISEVAFAAAADDSRPVLTGVLVQMSDEKITFAAADAFHLAVREADLPGDDHPRGDILIPARTLADLARILPTEGQVEMIVTPNRSQVLFHTANLDLVSRLIEGAFPPFRSIIPKGSLTHAVLETKEFAAAVKSTSLFARDSSNIARIKINTADEDGEEAGSVTIEATAEDLGDNVSIVTAEVSGFAGQVLCNIKYLSSVLNAIDSQQVQIHMSESNKPIVIEPIDTTKYQLYVIMPMHKN